MWGCMWTSPLELQKRSWWEGEVKWWRGRIVYFHRKCSLSRPLVKILWNFAEKTFSDPRGNFWCREDKETADWMVSWKQKVASVSLLILSSFSCCFSQMFSDNLCFISQQPQNTSQKLHLSLTEDSFFLAIPNHQPAKTIDHHYNLVPGMFSPTESHPCLHKPVGREQPSCTTCDSPL